MGISQAVIYTRISEDRDGNAVAVDRQEKDCRKYAASLGLTVSDTVYSDNSISATKGKVRPGFEALLRARPAAIVVWHQDRLLRVSKDLERVLNLNIPVHSVTGGTLDLATPQGRAVARTVTAWTTYEGEQKALRQLAKNQQLVASGYPVPGRRRWGFANGNVTAHPVEAPQVLDAFQRVRQGASLNQLAKEYGIPRINLLRALTNRAYIGEIPYGDAYYPAAPEVARLVPVDLFDDVQAIMRDPSRKPKVGNQVAHLASGLGKCGECGAALRSKTGYYICMHSFAHVAIKQETLDEVLMWEVFTALSKERTVGVDLLSLEETLTELEAERTDLSGMLLARGVDRKPILARLTELDAEAQEVTERIHHVRAEHVAAGVVAEIRQALLTHLDDQAGADWWEAKWATLDLSTRRELVRGLDVVVHSGRGVDRVLITPKL